ncbi:MAG: laccase domain-containing protein [Anaerotardibacter sp.]
MRVQLENQGVDSRRIVCLNKCTVCNNHEFFSYRGQNGVAGRHGAFAVRTR